MIDNLTFIVTFRDGHDMIEATLDSIPSDSPVILVDDQSERPYQTTRPNVRVIRTPARAYPAGACNLGIQSCQTDVVLMGQDNQLIGDNWKELLSVRDQYGTIGDGIFGHPCWPRGYVQATWMFMSREAINKTGLFNAVDYPAWGCTAEWQLRMCRKGLKALPTKVPGLEHRRGKFGRSMQQALKAEPHKAQLLTSTPPALTIAVPCYNYGRYLPDAINSLIGGQTSLGDHPGQSFQSFEVFIVDDASTDNSAEIGQSLADEWKGIHLVRHLHNRGTAATVNTGLRSGHGRYVTTLSADDMMESTRLETLYRVAQANPHSLVYDDLTSFRNGKRTAPYRLADYDFDTLLYRNHVPYGIMFTRHAYDEVDGYPDEFARGREDWAMAVRLGLYGYCGIHVKQQLMLYRREKQNRTLTNTSPYHHEKFLNQLMSVFPEAYDIRRRPDMCCGSSRARGKVSNQVVSKSMLLANLPGAEGMVQVEYLGKHSNTMTFHGAATYTQYAFGGQRRIGWVDSRDADALLETYEGPKKVFRLYQKPIRVAPVAPMTPVEPIAPVETSSAAIALAEAGQVVESVAAEQPTVVTMVSDDVMPTVEPEPKRRGRRSHKDD